MTLVQSSWEEAQVPQADLVLCSHVLYTVRDIGPFIKKLDRHARGRVLVAMYMDPPQYQLFPFWRRVHGGERRRLPCLPELLPVLWELGIYPDLEMQPAHQPRVFEDQEGALRQLRSRLFVQPGTAKDRKLQAAIRELLEETPEGLRIRNAPWQRPGLVSWRPSS